MPSKHEARIAEVRDIPGLAREQVIETIKPTILIHGEVVQQGEVVVGRPAPPQYAAETMQPGARADEGEEKTTDGEPSPSLEPENEDLNASAQGESVDESETVPSLEPENGDLSASAQNEKSGEHEAVPVTGAEGKPGKDSAEDIPSETDESSGAENPAAAEAALKEDIAEGPAGDDEPVMEIPLPQKRTRRKGVLPASVKTKLAAIPEIGESTAEGKKEGTAPKRGRKRTAAAGKKVRNKTDGNPVIGGEVREEEA
jgi:hypothetical protein